MNSLSATEIVLTDAGAPMHYSEITRRILERDLWKTDGKTPAQTINAQLVTDIKRKGDASRFRHVGPGMFSINRSRVPELSDSDTSSPRTSRNAGDATIEQGASARTTVSFANAAEQVLERFAERQPMHYGNITEKALDLGLITTQGKTPKDTMYSQILTEIHRNTRRGEMPRFSKYGKGFVGLSKWAESGLTLIPREKSINGSSGINIDTQIVEHNKAAKKALLARLQAMKSDEFEHLIRTLLVHLGFTDVIVTSPSRDGGIDVRGTLVVGGVIRTHMAVQAKCWKNNVQRPTIQQVRGSLGSHDKGLVITTSDFSSGAKEESERGNATPVALMNGEQLIALLIEHSIGIRRSAYELIELADPEETEGTITLL
jgi:restriction system protein